MSVALPPITRPTLVRAWGAVAILMAVTFTATLDRYLPSIMIDPMKHDLGISDTQISLVQGMAFSLFYAIAGLPLGRLVDHRNRRNLVAAGVLLWTCFSIWTGLAGSFTELFIARAGVGIGEAVLAPAAYSIIADLFPNRLRGRAISIYFTALVLGTGMSYILGGALLAHLEALPVVSLPILGVLTPWRATYILMALLGFPAALLTFGFREPVRTGAAGVARRDAIGPFLKANTRAITLLICTFGFIAALSVMGAVWGTTVFSRTSGVPVAKAAVTVGIIMLAGGLLGPLLSGALSDYFARNGEGSGRLRVALIALVVAAPVGALWPVMPTPSLSYFFLWLDSVALGLGISTASATIQDITPNRMRGQLLAVNQIVMLLASALAPTIVALVTDRYFQNPQLLALSVAWTSGILGAGGIGTVLLALQPYAAMRARQRQVDQDQKADSL